MVLELDSSLVSSLRADLERAHFTVDHLTELWGDVAEAALGRADRVPARRALTGSADPAAALAELFVFGVTADASRVEGAMPSLGLAGAERLGVIARKGDLIRPLVDLRPYAFLDGRGAGEWWIASDIGELAAGVLRTDHVLGVGGASITLAGLIMPGRIGRALDLGTGCGIQALHLAREADLVVATDISQRALDYAALNAGLNGVTTIEFRLGSLFEPVSGERFDRIVSNPPFVITPRTEGVPEYEYRDGGLVGDDLFAAVVAGLSAHLTPGGVAQLLGNWEYRPGSPGLDAAGAWAQTAGLDAWIVERDAADPAQYAETWIRDGGTRGDSDDYERLVGAWLDDFEARGVISIGFGYLTLRRPVAARTLHRLERVDAPLGAAASGLGQHLADALAAHDALIARDDAALLASHLVVAPDVTDERSHWPGSEHPSVIVLRQGGGFRREVRADTGLAAIVGACDGELSLGSIISAVASLLEIDEAALVAELVPQVRELIVAGLLRIR